MWARTSVPEEPFEQRPHLLARELLTPWGEAVLWTQLT